MCCKMNIFVLTLYMMARSIIHYKGAFMHLYKFIKLFMNVHKHAEPLMFHHKELYVKPSLCLILPYQCFKEEPESWVTEHNTTWFLKTDSSFLLLDFEMK